MQSNNFTLFAFNFFNKNKIFTQLGNYLQDKSFFMTGGTGLFGRWITEYFNWLIQNKIASPKVTILTRNEKFLTYPFINKKIGSLESFDFGKENFNYLIHLAAPSATETFGGMNDIQKIDTLYNGSKNILKFSKNHIINRIIFTSSGAIYGGLDKNSSLIDENCRLAPLSTTNSIGLSIGKRVAEYLFYFYSQNSPLDISIARCFSFVGPGLPTHIHYAIGNFVKDAILKKPILIKGNGEPIRSYMYLGDMVYWILKILFEGQNGRDYNVGSEHEISILELAKLVQNLLNPTGEVIVEKNKNFSTGTPPNYFNVPDTQRSRNELGLEELFDLKDSILNYGKYIKETY